MKAVVMRLVRLGLNCKSHQYDPVECFSNNPLSFIRIQSEAQWILYSGWNETWRRPDEMTVHFIVSEHSRLQQPAPPTTPPLSNSRPVKALHTHPFKVSSTPFGTAKTRQCPPLKQENSLIFGPWFPIHVFFLYKSYTMLHLIIRIQFNWLTLVFGHHLKCDQIL